MTSDLNFTQPTPAAQPQTASPGNGAIFGETPDTALISGTVGPVGPALSKGELTPALVAWLRQPGEEDGGAKEYFESWIKEAVRQDVDFSIMLNAPLDAKYSGGRIYEHCKFGRADYVKQSIKRIVAEQNQSALAGDEVQRSEV